MDWVGLRHQALQHRDQSQLWKLGALRLYHQTWNRLDHLLLSLDTWLSKWESPR